MVQRIQIRNCLYQNIWGENQHTQRRNKLLEKIIAIMILEKAWRVFLLVHANFASPPKEVLEHYEIEKNKGDYKHHAVLSGV